MPVRHVCRLRARWCLRTGARRDFEGAQVATEFACSTYALLRTWFGTVEAEGWPIDITLGRSTGLLLDPWDKRFIITIHRESHTQEQRAAAIAHEMYHRVTYGRTGLLGDAWIDEMLAFASSQEVLRRSGFVEYAAVRTHHAQSAPCHMSLEAVKCARLRLRGLGLLGWGYPVGFAPAVKILAERLVAIVGHDTLWRIAAAERWEDWLMGLPADARDVVCRVLRLED